jgi:non-heme chloroperoxidase
LVHRDPAPLKTLDVPILIMDGDDDQILPIDGSVRLSAKLVRA